jgi:hypothetical protein
MDWGVFADGAVKIIAAVGVIFAGYWAYQSKKAAGEAQKQAEKNEAQLVEIDGKVYELGKSVDGRLSQLLDVSALADEAKGYAKGEQAQRDRSAESDLHRAERKS